MLVEPRRPLGAELLERVLDAVASALGAGRVRDAIPALAPADPRAFGFAVAGVDGEVHGIGDRRRPFSIQSISKAFALALRRRPRRRRAVVARRSRASGDV